MSRIGQKDTAPEMIVRRALHALGYRYRLHAKDLPGRPDIVFRSRRTVIFVHGCFWHGHQDASCPIAHTPKSNRTFWLAKIARNQARDGRKKQSLIDAGWRVLEVWECDLKDVEEIVAHLSTVLGPTRIDHTDNDFLFLSQDDQLPDLDR